MFPFEIQLLQKHVPTVRADGGRVGYRHPFQGVFINNCWLSLVGYVTQSLLYKYCPVILLFHLVGSQVFLSLKI